MSRKICKILVKTILLRQHLAFLIRLHIRRDLIDEQVTKKGKAFWLSSATATVRIPCQSESSYTCHVT